MVSTSPKMGLSKGERIKICVQLEGHSAGDMVQHKAANPQSKSISGSALTSLRTTAIFNRAVV